MISPCVKLCVMDDDTGLCAGCGRTREEIGNWLVYSEAERHRIMAALPSRRARAGGDGPGP
jgi:predicted Fe-S protein YdhL (DUF1289 family)